MPSRVRLFETPWTVSYPPGSSVHGIFQARILEWVAISYSRGSSHPRDRTRCLLRLLNWQANYLPLHHLGSQSSWVKHKREVLTGPWVGHRINSGLENSTVGKADKSTPQSRFLRTQGPSGTLDDSLLPTDVCTGLQTLDCAIGPTKAAVPQKQDVATAHP